MGIKQGLIEISPGIYEFPEREGALTATEMWAIIEHDLDPDLIQLIHLSELHNKDVLSTAGVRYLIDQKLPEPR